MKRVVLTAIGVLLVLGGLTAIAFSVLSFVRVAEGVMISAASIGQYLPGYFVPGVIAEGAGLVLLIFRGHF